MEWGCMQALIDFDGWRKWKDFSQNGTSADDNSGTGGGPTAGSGAGAGAKKSLASSKKKKRQSMGSQNGAAVSTSHLSIKEEDEKDAT
jgi:osomolarity two-component system response regulator SSK1